MIKVKVLPLSHLVTRIHGDIDEIIRTKDYSSNSVRGYTIIETKRHLLPSDCYTFVNAAELFRDYFNNFLSIEGFALHYGISKGTAEQLIKQGRDEHEAECHRKEIE